MKLNTLEIHNFKGIKHFQLEADGHNVVVTGANGSGKTTIYDAFLWLLFGKDSTGRKDFQVRPLDKDNQVIPELVVEVTATLDFNGTQCILKKEHIENRVKKDLRGYNTLCWIDDVPLKVGEYQKAVDEMIDESTFKMLTDVHYFNGKLHWTDRRKILLDIAGDIDDPKGFEALLKNMAGRSLDDYKKVLADQKKRVTEERDEIPPRIDELQRRLETYATPGTKKNDDSLALERGNLRAQIDTLDKKRQALMDGEQDRQKLIDKINQKKAAQLRREAELESNTDGIQKQLDEKQTIQKGLAKLQDAINNIESSISEKNRAIYNDKQELISCTSQLDKIRMEYAQAEHELKKAAAAVAEPVVDKNCPFCKQQLPDAMLQETIKSGKERLMVLEAKAKARLDAVKICGNEVQNDVNICKKSIAEREAALKPLQDEKEKAQIKLKEGQDWAKERMAIIEKQIATKETTPPNKDSIWLALTEEITHMEAALGQPASQQIVALENERHDLTYKLDKINAALANRDGIKQDTARIKELQDREKELSQQLAAIEKQLADIQAYSDAQSAAVEEAVNGRFKHVTFKLFNHLLNGSTEDCCEALLNGVPYADCSYGQKIRMGIDVINVLVEHGNKDCPLFVDNSESLTYPIEYEGQTICLEATDSKQLKVTVK